MNSPLAVKIALGEFDFKHPQIMLRQVAAAWQESTGGTSGAVSVLLPRCVLYHKACNFQIYSLFFLASANAFTGKTTSHCWMNGLVSGTKAVMKYGGAKPGDRTLVRTWGVWVNSTPGALGVLLVPVAWGIPVYIAYATQGIVGPCPWGMPLYIA